MAKMTTVQRRKQYHDAIEKLLPYMERDLPNMANMTPAALVDEAGALNELKKDAEKVVKLINGIIDNKLQNSGSLTGEPEQTIEGEDFEMKLIDMVQVRLDTEQAKHHLAQAGVLDECLQEIPMTQHRYKRLK